MTVFNVTGYAVNKRGLTVGVAYQVEATDDLTARSAALSTALAKGLTYPRMLRAVPVPDDVPLLADDTTTHSVEISE
ncbi:hypothetical protein OD218_001692 [Salmonella enterica]|nr:hypothetical protein [Salmonella enterica]EJX3080038.1 hypothetical protein [Salmonella enterica]EJX3101032.1 hypothetical protein [Salmonella enterica]EJX3110875.1 hypothetical protein [Salmonella enterica]EJX3248008.1 hypothetical protein [Salmonella enterica]